MSLCSEKLPGYQLSTGKEEPPVPKINLAAQQHHIFCSIKKINYLWRPVLPILNARMAESVDALVSNTSSCKAVPVRSRLRVRKKQVVIPAFFLQFASAKICKNIPNIIRECSKAI